MIVEQKKKFILLLIIATGLFSIIWYSSDLIPTEPITTPDELRIRDGQTVVLGQIRVEYLYKYKMVDNSTKNVLLISGLNKPFTYEVIKGGTINLYYKYNVITVSSTYVTLSKVR